MEITVGSALFAAALSTVNYGDGGEDLTHRWYMPVLLLALLTQIRPEALAILGFYLGYETLRRYLELPTWKLRRWRDPLGYLAAATALATVVIAPYAIFSLATTGSPFPNTYAAKVGNLSLFGVISVHWYNFQVALQSGSAGMVFYGFVTHLIQDVLAFPLAYMGRFDYESARINFLAVPATVASIALGLHLALTQNRHYLLFLGLLLLIYSVSVGIMVPNDRVSWPWFRHMYFLIPILVMLPTLVVVNVISGEFSKLQRWALKIFLALSVVGSLAQTPPLFSFFESRVVAMRDGHFALVKWVAENLGTVKVIAASDIGVVGFYLGAKVIDSEGLINPEANQIRFRRASVDKDQEVYHLLKATKPEYFVTFPWSYPSLLNKGEFPLLKEFGGLGLYGTPWTPARSPILAQPLHQE